MAKGSPLYPASTIANLFNLTERRIQQLAAEGIIPKEARGKYDLVACVRGYIKYLQERAFGQDVQSSEFINHRDRLAKANADRVEMENDVMRGKLAPLDDVHIVWSKIVMDTRTRMLGIPSKAASGLAILTTKAEVHALLETEIHGALNDLAEIDTSSYLGDKSPALESAAAEANSQ
jgi:phage terminase Nu1 subunit (DNA packaging protein)